MQTTPDSLEVLNMFEYVKPSIEIISFVVREHFASSEDVDNNQFPLDKTEDLSFSETVEPWSI